MRYIRMFVYWLGFRPKFGTALHSPSREMQLAFRDALRNTPWAPAMVLPLEMEMKPSYESLLKENEELRSKYVRLRAERIASTVNHCNSKTNYEMIVHVFNPDGCTHCAEIRNILHEADKL